MEDKELYKGFSNEEAEQYAKEAKERWGNTEAYKQSQERVKKMSKEDFERIGKEGDVLMKEIVANREKGAKSPEVQALISRHFNNLRHFYEPTLETYRGLAENYVADERFKAFYEKYAPNLAEFMKEAMLYYCQTQEGK